MIKERYLALLLVSLTIQIVGGIWFLYWDEVYNRNMIDDLGIGRTVDPLALLLLYSTVCLIFAIGFAFWHKTIPRIISIMLVGSSLFFSVFLFSTYTILSLLIRPPVITNQEYVAPSRQYGFSDTEIIFLNIWLAITIIFIGMSTVAGLLALRRQFRRKLQ